MREITSFTKEWRELRLYKTRDVALGVKVVLEKKSESHITVYLDGLKEVPAIIQYGSDTKILIYANTPKDYDGTEEDKKRKIDEIITKAKKIYNGIEPGQIFDLQNTINEYGDITKRMYSITNRMKG